MGVIKVAMSPFFNDDIKNSVRGRQNEVSAVAEDGLPPFAVRAHADEIARPLDEQRTVRRKAQQIAKSARLHRIASEGLALLGGELPPHGQRRPREALRGPGGVGCSADGLLPRKEGNCLLFVQEMHIHPVHTALFAKAHLPFAEVDAHKGRNGGIEEEVMLLRGDEFAVGAGEGGTDAQPCERYLEEEETGRHGQHFRCNVFPSECKRNFPTLGKIRDTHGIAAAI